MSNDEQIATLKAALRWALDNGISYSTYGGKLDFSDSGCGCCSGREEPPAELRAVILDAIGLTPTGPADL